MKTKFYSIGFGLFLLSIFTLNAQTYYYSDSVQIPITEYKYSAIFYYDEIPTSINFNDPGSLIDSLKYAGDSTSLVVYMNQNWTNDLDSLSAYLNVNPSGITGFSFSFILEDSVMIYPSFFIVIKLKEGYELNDIQSLLEQYDLTYVRNDYEMIIAEATSPVEAINASNIINNTTMIDWCHPDFMVSIVYSLTPNDFLYPNQYYLNQSNDMDIDAPEAWDLTTGNGTVTVAVIDEGVANHYEMAYPSKVLDGWSWDGAGNPLGTWVNPGEKHGQQMAGIIAATQNNTFGISGVCPNARILPIRMPPAGTFNLTTLISKAILWAANNGADVINCSWNLGCGFWAQNISFAINTALNQGRGGLGCPVVFSTGNFISNHCVSFPANVPGVIAVSALNNQGVLTSYSGFDVGNLSLISVAAFGGNAGPGAGYDIYTTERMGWGSINGGGIGLNYIDYGGGTSSACAQTSGVAALLISIDPTLFQTEIYCRIRNSAKDIGIFGPDNFYGFGRLNAYYCVAINNLNLIDGTIAGLQNYATKDYITSGNGSEILPTAFVSLMAGKAVTLNPGFKTDLNCVFEASINTAGPCGTNAGGPFKLTENELNSNQFEKTKCIEISPNPTKYDLMIISKNRDIKINKIKITTVLGELLAEIKTGDTNSYLLDVSAHKPGIFFLTVYTNSGCVIKKIIKQ